jgi:formylmethanofuran--tetrahydromethanopterin N-formyltransferase
VLLFAVSTKELAKQVERRVGQCVLTCPTTAVYSGIDPATSRAPLSDNAPLGSSLRFFGDGWQIAKMLGDTRYWRVPVMDGEFVAEESAVTVKAVGGGNLLLLARDMDSALRVAESAVAAMRRLPNVIMPFPGGVVRSGSKVGSKYAAAPASTNDAFCPTLIGLSPKSELDAEVGCVLEIVIDGLTDSDVGAAMTAGVTAAVGLGRAGGVLRISAGNYGGKLGPYHFHLRQLAAGVEGRRA